MGDPAGDDVEIRSGLTLEDTYVVNPSGALTTGTPVTISDPHDGSSNTVLRLVRPFEVFTCSECYRQPQVQAERERLFRPEEASNDEPVA